MRHQLSWKQRNIRPQEKCLQQIIRHHGNREISDLRKCVFSQMVVGRGVHRRLRHVECVQYLLNNVVWWSFWIIFVVMASIVVDNICSSLAQYDANFGDNYDNNEKL